jgi:hypothetical protein
MGGSITVESQPGRGSPFRFDVAVRLAKAVLPPDRVADVEPRSAPGMRILLAEDNPTNRVVALRMLERLGHRAGSSATVWRLSPPWSTHVTT